MRIMVAACTCRLILLCMVPEIKLLTSSKRSLLTEENTKKIAIAMRTRIFPLVTTLENRRFCSLGPSMPSKVENSMHAATPAKSYQEKHPIRNFARSGMVSFPLGSGR